MLSQATAPPNPGTLTRLSAPGKSIRSPPPSFAGIAATLGTAFTRCRSGTSAAHPAKTARTATRPARRPMSSESTPRRPTGFERRLPVACAPRDPGPPSLVGELALQSLEMGADLRVGVALRLDLAHGAHH